MKQLNFKYSIKNKKDNGLLERDSNHFFGRRRFLQRIIKNAAIGGLFGVSAVNNSFSKSLLQSDSSTLSPKLLGRVFGAKGSNASKYAAAFQSLNTMPDHIDQWSNNISFRAHGSALDPNNSHRVILFARRPGIKAVEVDLKKGTVKQAFNCEPGYHLFGHGCFSQDGSKLYTTESEYDTGTGKIIVRDVKSFKVLERFDSYGIGPHEIKRLPRSDILVVANGGLLTHPKTGKKNLNLSSMVSNLTYINANTGKRIESVSVSHKKASIRHIDVSDDGVVAMGFQVQREAMNNEDIVNLAASHRLGETVKEFNGPENLYFAMNDYVGSVAISSKARLAGFTSPRGNLAGFWNIDTGEFKGYQKFFDVCGITVSKNADYFILSNSEGKLRFINTGSLKENKQLRIINPSFEWDNHIISV